MATFAPHVERAVKEINARFPALGPGGTYPNHGTDEPGGLPEEFYNADFWSTVKSVHDEAFSWIIANAKRLGLHYVISWDRIWNIERADEGVRRYVRDANNDGVLSASERHTNHIHTAFFETPPEEDMPSVHEVWNGQQEVDNVWHPRADGSPGGRCLPATALEEIGRDGNRIQAELASQRNQLAELNAKLTAILAKLP